MLNESTQFIPGLLIYAGNIYSVTFLCHEHTKLSPCSPCSPSPAENVDIKHLITNIINTNVRNFQSLIIAINGHGLPFLL